MKSKRAEQLAGIVDKDFHKIGYHVDGVMRKGKFILISLAKRKEDSLIYVMDISADNAKKKEKQAWHGSPWKSDIVFDLYKDNIEDENRIKSITIGSNDKTENVIREINDYTLIPTLMTPKKYAGI